MILEAWRTYGQGPACLSRRDGAQRLAHPRHPRMVTKASPRSARACARRVSQDQVGTAERSIRRRGVLSFALAKRTSLPGGCSIDKTYDFTIRLGARPIRWTLRARSFPPTGCPTASRSERFCRTLHRHDRQVPPAFSELKVEGERAYDWPGPARKSS